ncbi:MAG: nucleotidyltransferase domain-containing protein [Muribaculaceae bacterium]|nr:nucleotidyltransferase domain-containing protein [Muribaculaceae bacterium]
MNLIYKNMDKIVALCRKYRVKNMYVFGSILTPRFNEKSDVDFLVNFTSDVDYLSYADNILDFYADLKELFGRNVDLIDESSIKNPYFKSEIERTKQLVYG